VEPLSRRRQLSLKKKGVRLPSVHVFLLHFSLNMSLQSLNIIYIKYFSQLNLVVSNFCETCMFCNHMRFYFWRCMVQNSNDPTHYPRSIDPLDLFNKRKISADIFPFVSLWYFWGVWLTRNRLIFDNVVPDWDMTFKLILRRLALWLWSGMNFMLDKLFLSVITDIIVQFLVA